MAASLMHRRMRRPLAALLRPLVRPPVVSAGRGASRQLPPRPAAPPEWQLEERYLKGSGPGGQKINKTNSAVQLKHLPSGIVVKSQATRSRSQNRSRARQLLAQRLDHELHGPASRAAQVADLKRKRAASASKKSRRKYRRLQQEKLLQDESDAPHHPLASDRRPADSLAPALEPSAASDQAKPNAKPSRPARPPA